MDLSSFAILQINLCTRSVEILCVCICMCVKVLKGELKFVIFNEIATILKTQQKLLLGIKKNAPSAHSRLPKKWPLVKSPKSLLK